MGKIFSISRTVTLVAAAIAIALCSASASFAQIDSQSGADRAREAQMKVLKGKIDQLQAQLGKLESAQHAQAASPGNVTAKSGKGCCPGRTPSDGSAGSSEPSPGTGSEQPPAASTNGMPMEHGMPMGNPMGGKMGNGMGGGGMQGGADGGAQPQASPSAGME